MSCSKYFTEEQRNSVELYSQKFNETFKYDSIWKKITAESFPEQNYLGKIFTIYLIIYFRCCPYPQSEIDRLPSFEC